MHDKNSPGEVMIGMGVPKDHVLVRNGIKIPEF